MQLTGTKLLYTILMQLKLNKFYNFWLKKAKERPGNITPDVFKNREVA